MAMRAYLPAPSPAPGCVSYTYETLPTGYRAKIGSEQFLYVRFDYGERQSSDPLHSCMSDNYEWSIMLGIYLTKPAYSDRYHRGLHKNGI